eukprot:1032210-Amphidinium_carterae.1
MKVNTYHHGAVKLKPAQTNHHIFEAKKIQHSTQTGHKGMISVPNLAQQKLNSARQVLGWAIPFEPKSMQMYLKSTRSCD